MRVVSLVPSVTETLLAWGVAPVAVTRYCEQPGYPTVGGTKNPDLDAIVRLSPDLVVLDEEENRRPDADALVAAGVPVHVTAVRSVDDVAPALAALAAAVGADPVETADPLDTADAANAADPATGAGTGAHSRRAFVPIWRRPWMTINADTYGASLLASVGWTTVFGDATERYPTVELDDVRRSAPDAALVPTEPYAFDERHCRELEAELGCPALLVDGKDLFWWGTRTPSALRRLAQVLP